MWEPAAADRDGRHSQAARNLPPAICKAGIQATKAKCSLTGAREAFEIKNRFEIRGPVSVILINSPKYGLKEVAIDTIDLPRAQEFPNTWCLHWDPTINSFYCRGKIQQPGGKRVTVYLHRWLTSCPPDLQVDHFDHDTLNNRRENLRIVTGSGNQQNPRGAQRNSKSGVLGVYWHKGLGRWAGKIEINGKQQYLGAHRRLSDAAKAVKEARAKFMPYSKEAVISDLIEKA